MVPGMIRRNRSPPPQETYVRGSVVSLHGFRTVVTQRYLENNVVTKGPIYTNLVLIVTEQLQHLYTRGLRVQKYLKK